MDKRLLPAFGPVFWCERVSEREWHDCKYCYRETPTFILTEGRIGSEEPEQVLRCCWECGSGLEIIHQKSTSAPSTQGAATVSRRLG